MAHLPLKTQIRQLKQKIEWVNYPLIIEMLNDARGGMPTIDMYKMYTNQLRHLEAELAKKEPPPTQIDLEDAIKNELENQ